jgi:hypothetical protein
MGGLGAIASVFVNVGGGELVAEGAGIVAEGAGIVAEGAGIVAEGAGIVAEGAGIVAEGAGIVAEGAGTIASVEVAESIASSVGAGFEDLEMGTVESLMFGVEDIGSSAAFFVHRVPV